MSVHSQSATAPSIPHRSPPAWEELASRLRPFIRRRVGEGADVEDVLQDILLRIHRGLPGLHDRERLEPWIYRLARNAIADHLRARVRRRTVALGEPLDGGEDATAPTGDAGDDREVARALAVVLGGFVERLPEPYREAVRLVDLEGVSHKEAARRLGLSISGAKSRVQRGRAKLRRMLDACCAIALDARGKVIRCRPRTGRDRTCYQS